MSKVPPPDAILRSLGNLLATKYLLVGSTLGVFDALDGRRWTSLEDLAEKTLVPRRTLRILVDALVVTGWVERQGDEYRNGEVAATYLGGGDGPDLRPVLRLWDRVVYPQWAGIEELLTTGDATFGFEDFSPEQHRDFTLGVATLTAPVGARAGYHLRFRATSRSSGPRRRHRIVPAGDLEGSSAPPGNAGRAACHG